MMKLPETSTAGTLQGVVIALTILDCLGIGLRLYTRKALGHRIKADDWLALVALSFVIVLAVYFLIGVSKRYVGYPLPADFTGKEYHPLVSGSLQHFYIWHFVLFFTLWMIKTCFVLFYRRVLVCGFKDWANVLVWSTFAIVTAWTIAFTFAWGFACHPIKGFWSFPYGSDEGPCVDTWKLNSVMAISDTIIDVIILLVPVPLVWRLRMSTSRKLAVILVFFLGGLAVAASVMRMDRVLYVAVEEENAPDGLLLNTTVLFWGMLEANLGLLAACLPTLRALFKSSNLDSVAKGYRGRTWLRSTQPSSPNNVIPSSKHSPVAAPSERHSPSSPSLQGEMTKTTWMYTSKTKAATQVIDTSEIV
ncbi:unnamed protein product [Periconia digitata]|uniref:Rhodopsin domain-containing protein n=1 Tax=Periconia digitata TaxID=1303443 RepID=A0A9W4U7L7_9PLEO|nr:unnamed protein product [Periconia digitata]